jgi:hypothetical protein
MCPNVEGQFFVLDGQRQNFFFSAQALLNFQRRACSLPLRHGFDSRFSNSHPVFGGGRAISVGVLSQSLMSPPLPPTAV